MRHIGYRFSLASVALLACSIVAVAYSAVIRFVDGFLKIVGQPLVLFRLPSLADSMVLVGSNGAAGTEQSAFERTHRQRSAARNI